MRHMFERPGRVPSLFFALALLSVSCKDHDHHHGPGPEPEPARSFVYIETNDPVGNAILAFERADDGSLTALEEGPFATGGSGISAGRNQRLGPMDSDQNMVLSEDKKLLFAVNSGSGTIAVFRTRNDGVLTAVEGSPFASGGKNPVSLGLVGQTLYVVNKEIEGSAPPLYAVLTIEDDGALTLQDDLTITTELGGSPSIAYVSPDEKFLFGTQFFDGARPEQVIRGQIDSFQIGDGGRLSPAEGAPYALPPDTSGITSPAVALNLVAHPTEGLLYVGFPARNEIGVYSIDERGALTFVEAVPNSGKAPCWFLINQDGSRLYTTNSLSGSLSIYDLSRPESPAEVDTLNLKNAQSGPPFVDADGVSQTVTSQPFQFAFDAEEKHLYVVSQRVTTNAEDEGGNLLHILNIADDGSLTERAKPIDLGELGVSATARPQGVLVF